MVGTRDREGQLDRVVRHLRLAATPDPGGASDDELLGRFAAARDGDAFAALVRRYGPMVFGTCRRVLGDHHRAEDAFQATFLVLARRAGAVRGRGSVAGWLFAVARRTAGAVKRADARRRVREASAPALTGARPDDGVELRAALDEELARLPEGSRAVLVLSDLEGRPRAEVAAALGVPEGTVASRLARARAALGDRLRRRGWGPAVVAAGLESVRGSAGVPAPQLMASTTESAVAFAAGVAAPSVAVDVAREVVRAMWWTKVKVAAAGALAVGLLAGGLTQLPGSQSGAIAAAAAGDPPRAVGDGGRPDADGRLEETLLGLERRTWEATRKRDWEAIKALVADDFLAITGDGKRLDGEGLVKELAGVEVTTYALDEVKLVRLTPDAAVLTYRAKVGYKAVGIRGRERLWVSSGWARRQGKWVNVTYHETAAE